jgi:hypothetical protein
MMARVSLAEAAMSRRLLVCLLASSLLVSCVAEVRPVPVKVSVGGEARGAGFCPPGQAKKGRC